MKVLLIYPPFYSYENYWHPHLGLGYLAVVLRAQGYKLNVLDTVAEKIDYSKIEQYLNRERYDVVGITSTTPEIFTAHKIATIAKKAKKDTTVIIGGSHSTALPYQTLEEFTNFDIAVAGEGEQTILEILESVKKDKDLSTVDGISFRKEDGIIISNKNREVNRQLDKLPFPLWESFPIFKYRSFKGIKKKIELPIITGRGCPSQCVFCQRALGNAVRLRTIGNVIQEIERNIRLGAERMFFCDETFTLYRKRTIELTNEIMARRLNKRFRWQCETRVDRVDLEMLRNIKKAGCDLIHFGVESGNDYILQMVKKGITVKQVESAFQMAKQVGLQTFMFMIFGLPYENEATLKDSLNLIRRTNPDYLTIGILVPFPGTEVIEMAKNGKGGLQLASLNWENYGKQQGNALSLRGLDKNILKRYQSKAYTKFYFRPARISRLMEVTNPKGLSNFVFKRLKELVGKNIHNDY